MTPNLYTRAELLKYIRMNKPNRNTTPNEFMGFNSEQITYIHENHGRSICKRGDIVLLGDGNEVVVENGYILPYEPKEKHTVMTEKKYTKQELWMAYNAAASEEWITFNDFFEKTFSDTELPQTKQVTKNNIPTREQFVIAFKDILTCASINISLDTAERIVRLYKLAQEKGSKATIEDISEAVNERQN